AHGVAPGRWGAGSGGGEGRKSGELAGFPTADLVEVLASHGTWGCPHRVKELAMHGLALAELEAEALEVLPERNTMALINIGSITLLNGLNVLNNNNIGVIANLLSSDNTNKLEQHSSSNDLVTCVIGLAFDGGNSCHD